MYIRCTVRTEGLARLSIVADNAAEVSGSIRGPFCRYSRTLPSNYPVSRGEACIVDPCYWSPALPFRYELCLEVTFQNGNKDRIEFLWGLRCCIPHKHDLRLQGKRHVVRAVQAQHRDLNWKELRNAATALVTRADNQALFDQASEMGVMVIVAGDRLSDESYRGLNLFPAVHFVKDFVISHPRSDLLRIGSHPANMANSEVQWVDAAMISQCAAYSKPVFAAKIMDSGDLADMRKACDRLQRDLAGYGQFAGYVIHSSDAL